MNIKIPNNLSPDAEMLVQALVDTRQHELAVLDDLTDDQIYGAQMRITEPPIWELGHVGWFQEN